MLATSVNAQRYYFVNKPNSCRIEIQNAVGNVEYQFVSQLTNYTNYPNQIQVFDGVTTFRAFITQIDYYTTRDQLQDSLDAWIAPCLTAVGATGPTGPTGAIGPTGATGPDWTVRGPLDLTSDSLSLGGTQAEHITITRSNDDFLIQDTDAFESFFYGVGGTDDLLSGLGYFSGAYAARVSPASAYRVGVFRSESDSLPDAVMWQVNPVTGEFTRAYASHEKLVLQSNLGSTELTTQMDTIVKTIAKNGTAGDTSAIAIRASGIDIQAHSSWAVVLDNSGTLTADRARSEPDASGTYSLFPSAQTVTDSSDVTLSGVGAHEVTYELLKVSGNTVTLPHPVPSHFSAVVIDGTGSASTRNITVDVSGAGTTINNTTSVVLDVNYGLLIIEANNGKYYAGKLTAP